MVVHGGKELFRQRNGIFSLVTGNLPKDRPAALLTIPDHARAAQVSRLPVEAPGALAGFRPPREKALVLLDDGLLTAFSRAFQAAQISFQGAFDIGLLLVPFYFEARVLVIVQAQIPFLILAPDGSQIPVWRDLASDSLPAEGNPVLPLCFSANLDASSAGKRSFRSRPAGYIAGAA